MLSIVIVYLMVVGLYEAIAVYTNAILESGWSKQMTEICNSNMLTDSYYLDWQQ